MCVCVSTECVYKVSTNRVHKVCPQERSSTDRVYATKRVHNVCPQSISRSCLFLQLACTKCVRLSTGHVHRVCPQTVPNMCVNKFAYRVCVRRLHAQSVHRVCVHKVCPQSVSTKCVHSVCESAHRAFAQRVSKRVSANWVPKVCSLIVHARRVATLNCRGVPGDLPPDRREQAGAHVVRRGGPRAQPLVRLVAPRSLLCQNPVRAVLQLRLHRGAWGQVMRWGGLRAPRYDDPIRGKLRAETFPRKTNLFCIPGHQRVCLSDDSATHAGRIARPPIRVGQMRASLCGEPFLAWSTPRSPDFTLQITGLGWWRSWGPPCQQRGDEQCFVEQVCCVGGALAADMCIAVAKKKRLSGPRGLESCNSRVPGGPPSLESYNSRVDRKSVV